MARKMRIPEDWLKARPDLKNVPHLYTVDQAVGLDSPNKSDDVMLVQFMLSKWLASASSALVPTDSKGQATSRSVFGEIPLKGEWDLTTLGFIFIFQIRNRATIQANGRFDPIKMTQLPSTRDSMILLNGLLLGDSPNVFRDLTMAPGIPAKLALILKEFAK